MSSSVVPSVHAASPAKPAAHKDKRPNLVKTRAGVSGHAQRVAAAILEVLAGVRTPTEAAKALGFAVPRYYLWEQRALDGLVRACEPRPVGKVASERHRVAVLEKEAVRLRQECVRQQALARAAQRTLALAAAAATKPVAKTGAKTDAKAATKVREDGKAKRKRRPVARALKMAAALQQPAAESGAADPSSPPPGDVVQRSVPGSTLATAEGPAAAAAVSPV